MNEGVQRTARWIRDVLDYDEALILLGRRNFEREDFETAYITVDALGTEQLKSSGTEADEEAETETHRMLWSVPITMNFYGPDAHTRAKKLMALRRSQKSRNMEREHGIVVQSPENFTDVKALTGQQYGERIEVLLNVEYQHVEVVEQKRIDHAQLEQPLEGPA